MILLLVFCVLFPSAIFCCPPPEALLPCTCQSIQGFRATILCSKLSNEQDLAHAAAACKNKNYISVFSIDNSVFNYIQHDTFHGVRFDTFLVNNSVLSSISDTDTALEGVSEHVNVFRITDSTFLDEWEWGKLRHFSNLAVLGLSGMGLQYIDADIRLINKLKIRTLDFSKNDISWIYDNAFATMEDLIYLILNNNEISEVKRSMLPNPAKSLLSIDLSYNKIQRLPEDLLVNMPVIRRFSIAHNLILTLDEKTLTEVWERLYYFNAEGNDLRCDCRMSWILSKKFPRDILADCAEPSALKGKKITELSATDLWC